MIKSFTFFLAMLFWASGWATELQSTVDRNTLSLNETLVLNVRYDGQVLSDPDFSDLEIDFEILSQQQQNQLTIINGKRASYTTWTIQLLPKHTGKLLIPSFNLKGAVSNAIELNITDTPQNNTANDQPIFIETTVDKNSVYVQEQLILTHKLYTRVNLNSVSSDELTIKEANLIKIAETQYQKNLNGVPHLVIETKYAIFPETNGTLEIPSIRYSTVVPDNRDPFSSSFFSRGGKQVFLRSEQMHIEVKPRPPQISINDWLPSKGVSLTEKWSRPLDEFRVGEPITRTINIVAQGLSSVQLPPLSHPEGEDFRLYPDQPQLSDDKNDSGVIGSRIESVAIVPTRPGDITLPAITVNWWDTNTNQMRKTRLEAQTLHVLPALAVEPPSMPEENLLPSSDSTAETPNLQASKWLIPLAVSNLVLLTIVGLLVWQLLRQKKVKFQQSESETLDEKEQQLFTTLKQVAQQKNYAAFQQALFIWARVLWNEPQISTIAEITTRANSDGLTKYLATYDQQKYSSSGKPIQIDFNSVITYLDVIRKKVKEHQKIHKNQLKPLYG